MCRDRGDRLPTNLERDHKRKSLQDRRYAINESMVDSSAVGAGTQKEEGLCDITCVSDVVVLA